MSFDDVVDAEIENEIGLEETKEEIIETPSDNFQLIQVPRTVTEQSDEPDISQFMKESVESHYESNIGKGKSRLDPNKVSIVFYNGSRGAGKTTGIGQDATFYYKKYFSTWWLWASRSNENVFVAVSMNCKHKWNKAINEYKRRYQFATTNQKAEIAKKISLLENRLHCNCDQGFPINWLVPEYYDWKGVKEFNQNWQSKDEFDVAYENKWITRPYEELSRVEKELLSKKQLVKPKHLQREMIRICPFTIPDNPSNKMKFEKQFLEYAFQARKEHRWLIMNPLTFEDPKDKFDTAAYIFTRMKAWTDMYWQPNTPESVALSRNARELVPEKEWTWKERSHDKICLILAEIRTVAPTNKISPEKDAGKTKRPLLDFLPEARHMRTTVIADLQSSQDLNDSIRPMANHVIIKNSSLDLLGKEWTGFFNRVEKMRKERLISLSRGKFDDFKKAPPVYKNIIDSQLPRIEQLPKDKGFVVYPNGEFFLETFRMEGGFHHKQEHQTIQSVTGISWSVNTKYAGQSEATEEVIEQGGKIGKQQKDAETKKVMYWCAREFVLTKDWKKVIANLKEKVQTANIKERLPITGIENLTHATLSNRIRSDEYLKKCLDIAKKNRDRPLKELLDPLSLA